MTAEEELKELYAFFGEAVYWVQCIEYDLVSLWLLDSIHQGLANKHCDLKSIESIWEKKTLGSLLFPFMKSNFITNDFKYFLENIRQKRNYLVHSFFMEQTVGLQTEAGRKKALYELHEIIQVLREASLLFRNIVKEFGKEFGITDETIQEQMSKLGIPYS